MNLFNQLIVNMKLMQRLSLFILTVFMFQACDSFEQYELPEAGSKEDKTPPSADFLAQVVSEFEFLSYSFTNLSISATDYFWDFGDGNTATSKDATHEYADEGTYTVTLTASDKLGVESTISYTIEVVEPEAPAAIIPIIKEAGFEDFQLEGGTGDGRDSWRISGGKIFGITSSPVRTGSQGAKFDAGDPRVAYQALTVTPNTDYRVTMYYTMKKSPIGGEIRLAILGNEIKKAHEAEDAIIAFVTGNNQEDDKEFIELSLEFNSGNRETIAIWIDSNNITETRVDDVSIDLVY